MADFFAMGGYAAFVWPAYGASFLGVGAMIWLTLRDYRRAKCRLAQLERDDRS
ncbi:MAG TPA: heme exporter protein CcmD [Rhizomicrobium sp.]|nr:heme exporter protein CcmD [Rhizomicrobium sp.]